ncbi:hypothetical protein BKA69DRAFT_1102946 [Paraphysoderma sedebokerense]|nr:hypothetical protein BKA69DRAFT_1102946 [Paraphysoderma sedebokerense]
MSAMPNCATESLESTASQRFWQSYDLLTHLAPFVHPSSFSSIITLSSAASSCYLRYIYSCAVNITHPRSLFQLSETIQKSVEETTVFEYHKWLGSLHLEFGAMPEHSTTSCADTTDMAIFDVEQSLQRLIACAQLISKKQSLTNCEGGDMQNYVWMEKEHALQIRKFSFQLMVSPVVAQLQLSSAILMKFLMEFSNSLLSIRIDDSGLYVDERMLCSIFATCPNLEIVDISSNLVTEDILDLLLKSCPRLNKLKLYKADNISLQYIRDLIAMGRLEEIKYASGITSHSLRRVTDTETDKRFEIPIREGRRKLKYLSLDLTKMMWFHEASGMQGDIYKQIDMIINGLKGNHLLKYVELDRTLLTYRPLIRFLLRDKVDVI